MPDYQESELFLYRKRLSVAIRAARVCVFEVDVERQLYTYFENSEAIFGVPGDQILKDVVPFSVLPPEEYQRKAMEYFCHPEDEPAVAAAFESIFRGEPATYEARMRAGGNAYVWCKIDVVPIKAADGGTKMIGVISDIHEMKDRLVSLERKGRLDTFTKLYSKRSFEEACSLALEHYPEERMALMIIDLDHFKEINDRYGHQAGDEVILAVASRLRELFGGEDLVARFGGDEFMVLMRRISSVKEVEKKAGEVLLERSEERYVKKSVGIALFPDTSGHYEGLFAGADQALYEAKKKRNTFVIFS